MFSKAFRIVFFLRAVAPLVLLLSLFCSIFADRAWAIDPEDGYTIQIASFSSSQRAQKKYAVIWAQLPPALQKQMRIEKVGSYFTIRAASLQDEQSAQGLLSAIHEYFPKAIIINSSEKPERVLARGMLTDKGISEASEPPQNKGAAPLSSATKPSKVSPPEAELYSNTTSAPDAAESSDTSASPSANDNTDNISQRDTSLLPLKLGLLAVLGAALVVVLLQWNRKERKNSKLSTNNNTPPSQDYQATGLPSLEPELEGRLARNIGELSQIEGNFAGQNASAKTIYVTSCFNGEGKTISAISLGHGLTFNGNHKVLIVDINPRTQSLHKLYGTPNAPGLIQILRDEPGADDAIRETKYPNISILPFGDAGSVRPNLLRGNRLANLMEELKNNYDYIIIDGHSVLASSDAAMVASKMDGIVIVIQCEKTKWEVVQTASEKIRIVGGKLLGTVLNRRKYYIPSFLYGKK